MAAQDQTKWVALGLCVIAFSVALGLRDQVNLWLSTGFAALASTVLLALAQGRSALSWFAQPSPRGMFAGVAVGLVTSLAVWWLYPLSTEVFSPIEQEVETLYTLLREPPGPLKALPLLLFVVAVEELVWRGLAIDLLSKTIGPGRAVVASALLYVLPQIAFRSPVLMLLALACGIVWGLLRVRFNGLAAPLSAHFVWNLVVFVLFPVA